jgi:hypothetical protein
MSSMLLRCIPFSCPADANMNNNFFAMSLMQLNKHFIKPKEGVKGITTLLVWPLTGTWKWGF